MTRYFEKILIVILFIFCTSFKAINNKLVEIINIDNFFCNDFNDNLDYLIYNDLTTEKKVKSISIYNYYSMHQKYLLKDSIIFNKKGIPVKSYIPSENNKFYRTYFFYDSNGNRYLDITIGSNNYDTTYVYRKFDKINLIRKEISYNSTRKEFRRIYITDLSPITDSILHIRYEFYESDLKYEKFLPFETRDIKVKILYDSIVQTNTNRIVQNDIKFNSSYTGLYKIEHNFLIPANNNSIINPKIDADCFETSYNLCNNKRVFDFYKSDDDDINNELSINQSIVQTLYMKIDSLPVEAWVLYRKKLNAFTERKKTLDAVINFDSIELKEGQTIDSFTPKLWYIVSMDSGYINGINNFCFVVSYNTPLKNDYDYNKRCLAIYVNKSGRFILKKQSLSALEDFNDYENDLLFDRNDETNFKVRIEDGNIVIDYSYMRGETSYIFSHKDGKWILDYYESNHRTCCQAESYSYNYITKKYSYSLLSLGEETEGDTAISVIQERPIMYMDSIYVRGFDFIETGLFAK